MLDRLVNIFFLFSLVFIFILSATAEDHLRITLALALALASAFIAFILNWLTLDGFTSAVLFGLIAYGLGGLLGAVVVLAFFISSSLLSKDMISEESLLDKKFRRDGLQVWSNGFWFTLWIIIWFLSKEEAFLIAGIASMAFATADTWASEVGGHRVKGKTWLVTNFQTVKPGTDGGISLVGTLASLVGAFFIGTLFWFIEPVSGVKSFFLVSLAGFIGSFIDSWLGAKFQGRMLHKRLKDIFARQITYVDNNLVNWLASGSSSTIALLTFLILGH
ncbi:MAG: DUF92 domain-containing protein [Balneola sp.]